MRNLLFTRHFTRHLLPNCSSRVRNTHLHRPAHSRGRSGRSEGGNAPSGASPWACGPARHRSSMACAAAHIPKPGEASPRTIGLFQTGEPSGVRMNRPRPAHDWRSRAGRRRSGRTVRRARAARWCARAQFVSGVQEERLHAVPGSSARAQPESTRARSAQRWPASRAIRAESRPPATPDSSR